MERFLVPIGLIILIVLLIAAVVFQLRLFKRLVEVNQRLIKDLAKSYNRTLASIAAYTGSQYVKDVTKLDDKEGINDESV